MQEIRECFMLSCSFREWCTVLIDLLVPIFLEVLIIGYFFDKFLDQREKKLWLHSRSLTIVKLLRSLDNILDTIVPASLHKFEPTRVTVGDISTETTFEWSTSSLDFERIEDKLSEHLSIYISRIANRIVTERQNLSFVIQASHNSLDPSLATRILELESSLSSLHFIEVAHDYQSNTITKPVYDLIIDVSEFRTWLIANYGSNSRFHHRLKSVKRYFGGNISSH